MIKAFIRKHSAAVYFALTFAISWGGVLGVVGPGGFPGTPEQFQALLPIAVAVTIAGPSIAGLVLIGLVRGRAGFREFSYPRLAYRSGGYPGAVWVKLAMFTPRNVRRIQGTSRVSLDRSVDQRKQ